MLIVNYSLYEMKYMNIFLTLRERVYVVKLLHSNAIFCLKLFLMQYRNYPKFVNMSSGISNLVYIISYLQTLSYVLNSFSTSQ